MSKIINENLNEWVDIKCAMFAASIKQKQKTIPNKMFNCSREIFFFVFCFVSGNVLAFVKTTIKMIGEEDIFIQFSQNTRNKMVQHAKISRSVVVNSQTVNGFLSCFAAFKSQRCTIHILIDVRIEMAGRFAKSINSSMLLTLALSTYDARCTIITVIKFLIH